MFEGSIFSYFVIDAPTFFHSLTHLPQTTEQVTHLFQVIIGSVFVLVLAISFILFVYYCTKIALLKKDIRACQHYKNPNIDASRHPSFKQFARACALFDKGHYFPVAEDWFNEETLAPYLTRSKLFPLFVSSLTGLGVLGTFVGLTIGLQDLILIKDVPEEIAKEITKLTAGASTAFITSVWGVTTSLILGFWLKCLSGGLSAYVRSVQELVEKKFPSRSPEEAFMQDVSENLRGCKEALDGLAEQIGEKMQEATSSLTTALDAQTENANKLHEQTISSMEERSAALAEVMSTRISNVIKDSIGDAILRAVDQVVKDSASTMRQTADDLRSMLNEFSKSTAKSGETQSKNVQDAIDSLKQTLEGNAQQNSELFAKLSAQQDSFAKDMGAKHDHMLGELKSLLDTFVAEVSTTGADQQKAISGAAADLRLAMAGNVAETSRFFKEMSSQQKEHAALLRNMNSSLLADLKLVLGRQQETMGNIENILAQNTVASGEMVAEVKSMLSIFGRNIGEMRALSEDMDSLCSQLKSASSSMERMGLGIDSTMKQVSASIGESVTTANNLLEESRTLGGSLSSTTDRLDNTGTKLDSASHAFTQSADAASAQYTALASKYAQLQQALEEHVENMNDQFEEIMERYLEESSKLMDRYVQQVNQQTADRLRAWDKETSRFCGNASQLLSDIGEVVDEMSKR